MHVGANAWLMMCAGEDRDHGGNDGYADMPDSRYLWDSTVGNATKVAVGDRIVLWDKETLLGVSVIEQIRQAQESKNTYKCPRCRRAHISSRTTKIPRYKCHEPECQELFDKPMIINRNVTTYQSHHAAGWIDLRGRMTGAQLRRLCFEPKSQGSLRLFKWDEFRELADTTSEGWPSLDHTLGRIRGGHSERTVRVRIGQAQFRQRLLDQMPEPACAFTGPAPLAVLEAGHLYSYATNGKHYPDGGLLMRRDIHALFDSGQLAVSPFSWTIDVCPATRVFGPYGALQGKPLHVSLKASQKKWLQQHWSQHRGSR